MSVMCESVSCLVAEDSFPVSTAAELYGKGKYFSVTATPPSRFLGSFVYIGQSDIIQEWLCCLLSLWCSVNGVIWKSSWQWLAANPVKEFHIPFWCDCSCSGSNKWKCSLARDQAGFMLNVGAHEWLGAEICNASLGWTMSLA